MNKLGIGLLSKPAEWIPPLPGSILWQLDPESGITESGGLVSEWASRRGAFDPTAVGSARPVWDGTSVEFDGVDDAVTQAASPLTNPDGAAQFTIAGWCRPNSVASTMSLVETGFFPNGILLISFAAGLSIYVGNNLATWSGGPLATGVWQFRAATYNGTRALGDRMRLYAGATVAPVAPSVDGVAVTTVPVAAGTAFAGGRATQFYDGALASWLMYSNIELNLAQLQLVAVGTAPPP